MRPADLDVYVDDPASFPYRTNYILRRALDAVTAARLQYRLLDRVPSGPARAVAGGHVALTEVPAPLRPPADRHVACLNGEAYSIDRRRYSTARVTRDAPDGGPVIVKTVLNHRGLPELRYRFRTALRFRWTDRVIRLAGRRLKRAWCPEYAVYPSASAVPSAVWNDSHLIVERFVPGRLGAPVVKYRYDFFLD